MYSRPYAIGLVALLSIVCPAILHADKVALTTGPEGVVINAGVAGQFTLEVPHLTKDANDYTGEKAVVTIQDASHEIATYPSGGTIAISIGGSHINCIFDHLPATAFALRFTTLIPITFGQGGKVALGDAPFLPLPAEKEKNFIIQDNGTELHVLGPLGDGYSLLTPPGFHEVGDNRFFNWPTFVHVYTYNLKDHPGNAAIFQVTGEPVADAKSGVAATPKFAVDRYGQLVSKSFPEKITSDQELKDDIAKEQAALDQLANEPRDSYGGVLGSGDKFKLKKTGFFRVDKIGSHDLFVTPEGNSFFQLAADCVTANDHTQVSGRERIYEWLPPHDGDFATAWLKDKPDDFSFYTANWIRKFGSPFDPEKFSLQALTRLRKWGFNSAGCWSNQTDAMRTAHFPVTPQLPLESWMAPGLKAMEGIDRMYDPFAPGTEEAIDHVFATQIAPQANDPTIIGYFLGNEQLFENVTRLVPAQNSGSPSKLRLVQLLQEKYKGQIAAFNTAWNPQNPFHNFDELKDAVLLPITPQARADMQDFLQLYLETHYETVSRIFHKYDHNHLLLGSRWQPGTSGSELLVKIAAKYMDVISVNYYTYAVEKEFLDRIHDWSGGKPMLLSEWSYGASTQGQMGGGREVTDQAERGLAYRNYVEKTASIPYVIGQQWFTYLDEPTTGRWFEGFNGEAGNTGFYNVADRPYVEFLTDCKKTNDEIYQVIAGERPPFSYDDARFSVKKGGHKSVSIPRALPGMKMDGTSRNWPGIPPEVVTPQGLAMGKANPDFGASFRLCWDDQNLYVLADVKDKTPLCNPFQGNMLWQGDALELFLGSEKPEVKGILLPTDRLVLLGAAEKPLSYVGNSPVQFQGIQVVTVRNPAGDGYTLEAAIPWAVMGIKPTANQEILFDLGIDNSDDGKLRSNQWFWNGTEVNSRDRTHWGRGRLL